ncbi:MAG TPA: Gfo/Idh/MocA family oxidoreductase [Gaiellaceae bacterium]|jgi:predicted dehydrogenase|nr:Gfo/Idh/MocA family oxidoreductase [Gaiellaceae bacterium]
MKGRRLRVGVLGCGVIAQVMHLPHLRQMNDRFEIVALCDLSEELVRRLGEAYEVPRVHTHPDDMFAEPLDALLVLSSGSHAPVACAAAEAGIGVFVEKPMCVTPREGEEMIAAAERAGVTLMVGYHKRYDPAYERALAELQGLGEPLLARTATFESPQDPYLAHHHVLPATDVDPAVLAELRADDDKLVAEALPSADEAIRRFYRTALIDSMIHDVNLLAGLCGRPSVKHAAIRADGLGVVGVFGLPTDADAVSTWTATADLVRYEQHFEVITASSRLALRFPSPFLRNAPTGLVLQAGDGTVSWEQTFTVSYDEAFRRELEEFHSCVVTGEPPRTNAREGLEDIRLLKELAERAASEPTVGALAAGGPDG